MHTGKTFQSKMLLGKKVDRHSGIIEDEELHLILLLDLISSGKQTVSTLSIIQVIINITMNCIGPSICKIK